MQVLFAPELEQFGFGAGGSMTPGRLTPGRSPGMTPSRMSPSRVFLAFLRFGACHVLAKCLICLPMLALPGVKVA